MFVKFLKSRSLDFCANCQRLGVSNFCKVVSGYRSRSRILKGKKVSGSQRKTQVSPSRCVAFTIRHSQNTLCILSALRFGHRYRWSPVNQFNSQSAPVDRLCVHFCHIPDVWTVMGILIPKKSLQCVQVHFK